MGKKKVGKMDQRWLDEGVMDKPYGWKEGWINV